MGINQNLRQLRLERGMTQEQVAERINVTRQAISSYESGRTRPDIDTLVRLGEIYGAELEEIVYGQSHVFRAAQRIYKIAKILFLYFVIMNIFSSSLLWIMNHWFAMEPVLGSLEAAGVFSVRHKLLEVKALVDGFILTSIMFGFFLLLILLMLEKCSIPVRTKIVYVFLLSAALLLPAFLLGASDPVYGMADYIITPVRVVVRMIVFMVVDLVLEFMRRKIKKKTS